MTSIWIVTVAYFREITQNTCTAAIQYISTTFKLPVLKEEFKVQGAKKVTFTTCHLGKLKLTFTSPNIISTGPKNVLMSRLISQFLCNLDSSKNFTCLSGKLITEFTSPIAQPTGPGLSNTTFFACWGHSPELHCASLLRIILQH